MRKVTQKLPRTKKQKKNWGRRSSYSVVRGSGIAHKYPYPPSYPPSTTNTLRKRATLIPPPSPPLLSPPSFLPLQPPTLPNSKDPLPRALFQFIAQPWTHPPYKHTHTHTRTNILTYTLSPFSTLEKKMVLTFVSIISVHCLQLSSFVFLLLSSFPIFSYLS